MFPSLPRNLVHVAPACCTVGFQRRLLAAAHLRSSSCAHCRDRPYHRAPPPAAHESAQPAALRWADTSARVPPAWLSCRTSGPSGPCAGSLSPAEPADSRSPVSLLCRPPAWRRRIHCSQAEWGRDRRARTYLVIRCSCRAASPGILPGGGNRRPARPNPASDRESEHALTMSLTDSYGGPSARPSGSSRLGGTRPVDQRGRRTEAPQAGHHLH